MKILHIIPSYKPAYIYGGTIESISVLCEAFATTGNDVTVYTTTANGKEELPVQAGKEYNIDGVKVFYFKRETKDPLHLSFALLKSLNKNCRQFDVVHIHSWWNIPAMLGAAICKRRKVKTVLSPRGMLSSYIINNSNSRTKQFAHRLFGASLLKYMRLHATSQSEMDECLTVIPGWKGEVIPNINRLPVINALKSQNPQFTIVFLSRIHPKKGLELLFEAVASINTPLCIKIAGTGDEDYINALKDIAKKLGIENKIQWLGWKDREEKFDVLAQADLFILTSYNENFANVVIEALHVGTPVLLTEGVALSAFVQQYELGWICKADPPSIKTALETTVADKEKRHQITAIAPSVIKAHFSPAVLTPLYQQLYTFE